MNFVSRSGIAFILIGRSVVQQACIFDVNSMPLKIHYLRNVSVAKTLRSNNVVQLRCTIKT